MHNPHILALIDLIDDGDIVLPAMQRPFVWQEDRMMRLLDSLMRKFPLGSLLIWKTKDTQRYRPFQKDVSSNEKPIYSYESKSIEKSLQYVLDGQQRLTTFYVALKGSIDEKRVYLDMFSGSNEDRDPGEMYYDFRFLSGPELKELNDQESEEGKPIYFFKPLNEIAFIDTADATEVADDIADKLKLSSEIRKQLRKNFNTITSVVRSERPLHVNLIDEHQQTNTRVEEILEIFVRVNSGGMVLYKADLLMSLLDISRNDVQPALIKISQEASKISPVEIERDMVLKSALLFIDEESRFDRLVSDREKVNKIASELEASIEMLAPAWSRLAVILKENCKIHTSRFVRRATNSLLPFVVYLAWNSNPSQHELHRIVTGIYIALMGGVFSGAEARMGQFTRLHCNDEGPFPLEKLAKETAKHRPVSGLDQLLQYHLDLTLNIVHGGVIIDGNPDQLERDHIYPKATLRRSGIDEELVNHYANFHFLRLVDNRNKTDKHPSEWFKNPGRDAPSYTNQDMQDRLLTWEMVKGNSFNKMIEERSKLIRNKALSLFHMTEEGFNSLFA